jgi:alpha-mannosidase
MEPEAQPKQYVLHMIGHGHIDPTWLWRWTEGYEEVRATFRSALERMEETPAFKFTASSACFYAWIEENDPEMFEQIRARVDEGRWDIAGGWWLEPDCNIPAGESFVRHGLYGQRYFQRAFGKRAMVGFNPDSFGHAGTFPQILSKLGLDYYVYQRPEPVREMAYPGGTTFWWHAQDGSEILACNLPESYNAAPDDLRDRVMRAPHFDHLVEGQTQIIGFYGVGNHGGGPTIEILNTLQELRDRADAPAIEFAALLDYFEAFLQTQMPASIPTITTDLQHHARGCYSAYSEIKTLNRRTEHALMGAERWATVDWLANGTDYPQQELERAWKDLLYNQFHDILAGSSIAPAYEDARDQLGGARFAAKRITNAACQRIARRIDTSPEGNTIVIFNPLPWPVKQMVTIAPIIVRELRVATGEKVEEIHLVDDTQRVVPHQAIFGDRIDRKAYAITAELPGLGYRCYHARPGKRAVSTRHPLDAGPAFLENTWWRIELDPRDGHITRLYDKKHKTEVLERGSVFSVLLDNSDTWSHGVDQWRVEEGRFRAASMEVFEAGDVKATVRVHATFGRSAIEHYLTLYRELDTIDSRLRINWQEAYRMLKVVYDTRVEDGELMCDTAYGCQERRPGGDEEPCQKWVDLTGRIDGKAYGLAMLNDNKYSFDVRDNVVRLTLLRSPAYAHHEPFRYDPVTSPPIMDQGWHEVRLQLVPHAGPWTDAGVVRKAWELNEPAVAHVESGHPGDLPALASFLQCQDEHAALTVLKKSEDGDDLILRGYETAGAGVNASVEWPFWAAKQPVAFAPHEIKTVRARRDDFSIEDVNLLEEAVGDRHTDES